MNAQSFLDNFHTIARAPGGIRRVRDLVYFFAITGGLSRPEAGDSDANLILDDSLQAKLHYYEEKSVRQGARKHSEIFQVVKRVPSHWVMVAAGDLVHLINGRAFKAADWKKSGLPIIRIQNLNNPTAPFNHFQGKVAEGHRVKAGDMLLSWSGTPGTSFGAFIWNGGDAVLNQHIFKVAIYSSRISKDYLRMAINASLDALIGSARGGVGLKHVTKGQIESLQIPLPPLEEQKRIVAKVDELMRLCDRLDAQQQEREKLFPLLSRANHTRFVGEPTEVNLRAIFHKPGSTSPIDFRATLLTLAVTGVLVTQDESDEHVSQYLSGLSLLSQPPSRPLPDKWMWVRVDEAGEVQLGRQRAPAYHKGPNMRPYLRVQNVYEARLDLSDVKSMEFDQRDFATFQLRSGDILLNEGQSRELVGRPALYAGEIENACFQNTLIRFRHRNFVDPQFALLVFRAYMRNGRFQQIAKQTTNIAHLGAGRFSALEFPLPPLAEQRRIVAKAAQLLSVVDRLEVLRAQSRDNAGLFSKAAVAAITSTEFTENERMKPPKTEVVTALKVGTKPKKSDAAPLARLLSEQNAEASAKTLWQLSELEINAFYRQLKTEMANGWIDEDTDKRAVKEVEAR